MKSGQTLNDFCTEQRPLGQGGQYPTLQTPVSQVEENIGLEVPGCHFLEW